MLLGGLLPFFPTKGSIEPGIDLNTIGGTGIYNLKGAYTNAPFSQSWGNLIVLSDGSKTQIVTEYTGSTFSIFIRGDNTRKWYKVNFTKDIWLLLSVQTNLQNGSTGGTLAYCK